VRWRHELRAEELTAAAEPILPLHDALLEDLLDQVEVAMAGQPLRRMTVSDLLRNAGVETNRFAVPPATVNQIIRMYADGASYITIGKRIGRAKSTVREVLVRNGVRLRDPHGREK